jgi:hypothetical protein
MATGDVRSCDSATATPGSADDARARRRHLRLVLVIAICVAPVVASYLVYYVFPPTARTNYGTLIEPQVELGPLDASDPLGRFKGQWILVTVQDGECDEACARRLFFMRQTHASLGKDRDRVDMVLLQTGGRPLSAPLVAAHPNLTRVEVPPSTVARWFPVGADDGPATEHLFVVDPQHNLMMRFPRDPDPAETRKDLRRLMRASRIG